MLARYFLRVALIFAAVLSMVQPAQASGTVASLGSTTVLTHPLVTGSYSTGDSLCNALGVPLGYPQGGYMVGTIAPHPSFYSMNCRFYPLHTTVAVYDIVPVTTVSCPVNASGTTSCVCNDSYLPDAGATSCVPSAPSSCTVYPVSTLVQSMSGAGDQPLQACMQNCIFDTGSGMSWGTAGNRQWASSGRSTGAFCATNTAAASSANDPACPAGQSLNASGVCAPLAMCPYDQTIYAINVNCHPALCASDVSLYATSPLCFAPAVSAVPVVVDCAVTPTDPICAGAASGTSPTVTGTPGTSGVYGAPTYSGGGGGAASGVGDYLTFDTVPDSVSLGDKTINVGTISPVLVGSSGGCPAPSPMVLHGHTYYFDWTTYCNFAAWIKPLLLAFSWLAAAGILVGGFVA